MMRRRWSKDSDADSSSSLYQLRPDCASNVPDTKFKIKVGRTLSVRKWQAAFTQQGNLHIASVLSRIQRGGVHPAIRNEVWEFLLGCFDPDSTFDERDHIRNTRRMQYARWKEQCRDMDSHVGSGKIITAPIITEDGVPIKDPLVLLEATSDQGTSQGGSTSSNNGNGVAESVDRLTDKQIIEWKLTLHQIGLDVLRTDRSMVFYEKKENLSKLWDILAVYAWIDKEVGYCQGMSDLCSPMIVLLNDEADAFWCFERLMRRLRGNFRCTQQSVGVENQLQHLASIIQVLDPKLHDHLETLGGGDYLFAFRMFMVLFRRELSFGDSLYLWEMMWALEYDPDMFSTYEEAGAATDRTQGHKPRVKPTRQFGKYERANLKNGANAVDGPVPISVFLVASVLKENSQKLLQEARGLDDLIRILNNVNGNLDAKKACAPLDRPPSAAAADPRAMLRHAAARRSAQIRRLLSTSAPAAGAGSALRGPCIVHKRGTDILHDPWYNKDTAFPLTERDRLGLRGLLPPRVMSFEQQYERFINSYHSLEHNTKGEPESVVSLAKWRILNRLHDRNETLYYRVLIDNIKDFAPIIYTPTVGLVCENYSGLFRRPRGMYFSAKDKGEMMSMIYNWPAETVDMIVVTDGSRILGLGDLGVQGIGIPIGKLDVYVAAAGINPQKVLPIMLDVGTNNQKLLDDKLYLGLRQPRLEGEEYLAVVDEFMEAVHARWPKAIVQFEDFQMKWAFETLQRYRNRFCMFNDDVQGTAGVALAGLLGAVRAQGRPLTDFTKQKIVVVGAGSAGLGVLNMAKHAMLRMPGIHKVGELGEGHNQFWVLDKDGLITKGRKCLDPAVARFARGFGPEEVEDLHEGASLVEVVKKVKPHVLLGLSGVGGIFTEEVLKAMKESDSPCPAIFAMSNPTTKAECTPEDVFKHVGENAVFASGSPFSNVALSNGRKGYANQANNMYLFPGIGLGALLSGARHISDGMLHAASECLASYITDDAIRKGILFPSISSIRHITARVGAAVARAAVDEDLAEGCADVDPRELRSMSESDTVDYVARKMWYPVYSPLVNDK